MKKRIRDSRVLGTRAIVEAVSKLQQRPQTFVCASAIGYYGDRADEILDETIANGSRLSVRIFVAEWEAEARAAGNLGLRVVLLRTGIVLGREGGALKQMLPPFRLGVGGPTGSGKQWMSWIHMMTWSRRLCFRSARDSLFGPVNATSPSPFVTRSSRKRLARPWAGRRFFILRYSR